MTCKKGDTVYLFSDGITDQFGGDKNKKFGRSRLMKELTDLAAEPLHRQKEQLEKAWLHWNDEKGWKDVKCWRSRMRTWKINWIDWGGKPEPPKPAEVPFVSPWEDAV